MIARDNQRNRQQLAVDKGGTKGGVKRKGTKKDSTRIEKLEPRDFPFRLVSRDAYIETQIARAVEPLNKLATFKRDTWLDEEIARSRKPSKFL